MSRYVVLTAPTCGKCRTLEKQVADQGAKGITFVDAHSDEGIRIATETGVMSMGEIIDLNEGRIIDLKDVGTQGECS